MGSHDKVDTTTKLRVFTANEVAQHDSPLDAWVVVDRKVYDVTKFWKSHPGGSRTIKKLAGRDATKFFRRGPHGDTERGYLETFLVGTVEGDLSEIAPPNGCIMS